MTSAPPPAPPTADPPPWQPLPPSGPPDRRQLRRSRTDKVLGGVNGGLAEYTGIDALLWRVGFVALTLAAGTGVLVYLLLWLLMPAGPAGAATPAAGQPAAAPREPAGPRSPIPGITLAALLILIGTLALIAQLTGWDIPGTSYLGAALAVVGAGLVAVAFAPGRRSRGGLIGLGVVLSLALAAAASGPWDGGSGVGDRTFSPRTVADVREVYSGGVGDLTVDLSDVPLEDLDEALEVRVEHGIGDVEVILPLSADAEVRVNHGVGDVTVFGSDLDGSQFFPGSGSQPWSDDDEAEFELVVESGIGEVEVSRG
ncbi:PspC domain-containing protein [Blastococcus saxobsidens]|uniref:PspC domain-containing protein n=1 Tax=Blastococcus saxobsidens TaxID=138336 RepID=A0A6L9W3X2_9ACTN|nr:PspC domain-containing protein [Blastococcus saxobsidens]NEK86181.1 PspC domain-containing protein [Blastococcus saxobsidens]